VDWTAKSSIIKKTLNPNWNETFTVPCLYSYLNDKSNSKNTTPTSPNSALEMSFTVNGPQLGFRVMDYDKFSSDDFEGDYNLSLSHIPNVSDDPIHLALENTFKGSISVSFQVKCAPRTSLGDLVIVKPLKRADFVKLTRNSWITGTVAYPMSPWERVPELSKLWERAQEVSTVRIIIHNFW